MKIVVQRVDNAKVTIDNTKEEKISKGLMILVGFTYNDNINDIEYIVKKILNLRIFEDDNNKMNYSVKDINGEILIVSQFTLYANVYEGNRPSFKDALEYNSAKLLFDLLVEDLKKAKLIIKTGKFGSDMKISLINNGPVTIIIDSKERKSI